MSTISALTGYGSSAPRAGQVVTSATPRPLPAPPAQLPLTALPVEAVGVVSRALGQSNPAYAIHAGRPGVGVTTATWGDVALSFSDWGFAATDRAGQRLSIRLAQVGSARAGRLPSGAFTTTVAANSLRFSSRAYGVSEALYNGPAGIEQTIVLRSAASGAEAGGLVVARLDVSGSTRPRLTASGRSVNLLSRDGTVLYTYGALSAHDASGRELPTRLAVDGRSIVLRVSARGARYPLTIDPLLTPEVIPSGADDDSGNDAESDLFGGGATGLAPKFGDSVAISADGQTILVGAPLNGQQILGSVSPGGVWVFARSAGVWSQQGSVLYPSDPTSSCGWSTGNRPPCMAFGASVALSADGNTALIGAPADGWGGGPSSAWVFVRTGTTWTQQGSRLSAPGEATSCISSSSACTDFGASVALSGDGNTALISDPATQATSNSEAGAAYIYTRSGATWRLGATINPPGDAVDSNCPSLQTACTYFGESVALSFNGNVALIGGPGDSSSTGAAWVFINTGTSWSESAKLTGAGTSATANSGAGSEFGQSVALSGDASTAIVAGFGGEEWIFASSNGNWSAQGAPLTQADDDYGQVPGLALSSDGDTALVGEPWANGGEGDAELYLRNDGTWASWGAIEPDLTGLTAGTGSVALSADGATPVLGFDDYKSQAGAAAVFDTTSYKVIFFAYASGPRINGLIPRSAHAFVQLREYSGNAAQSSSCTGPGVACYTFGKYPGSPALPGSSQCNRSGLEAVVGTSGCITDVDEDGPWTYRISFYITKQQYNEAMTYIDQQETDQAKGTLRYQLLTQNCMDFDDQVAKVIGLTLPDDKYLGVPDPLQFNDSLQAIGSGNLSSDGGAVQVTDGSTASGAPDPAMPADPSSISDLAQVSLASDDGSPDGGADDVASEFGFQHDTLSLPAQTLATGGTLSLDETGTLPTQALYAIDWGDGSTYDVGVADVGNSFTPDFTHTYGSPGSYTLHLIVIQGALEDYTMNVTVGSGHPSSASPTFTVAAPPSTWNYPYTFESAPYGPLAGSPGAPTIDTATAGIGSATVNFGPPDASGDSPVTGYTVSATDSTTPANGGQTATGSGSPITVTGLTPGDSYTFTVTASNAEGPGVPSAASNAVTPGSSLGSGAASGSGSGAGPASNSTGGSSGSGTTGGSTIRPDSSSPNGSSVSSPAGGAGTLTLTGVSVHDHTAEVHLRCVGSSGATCQAKLTLTVVEVIRQHQVIAVAAALRRPENTKVSRRTVTLASAGFVLSAGQSRVSALTLNGAGARLLERHRVLEVRLSLASPHSTASVALAMRTLRFQTK